MAWRRPRRPRCERISLPIETGDNGKPDRRSEGPAIAFQFQRHTPSPPLDRLVSSLWYARGRIDYGSERILPTGSAVLLINLGSPFRTRTRADRMMTLNTDSWLVGAQTGFLVSEPTAETHMMGVSFHPWGAFYTRWSSP